jgi:hypothetical protein
MNITSETTAKEIALANLTAKKLERAIEIYAKHRHKEARHKACDIVIEAIDYQSNIEASVNGDIVVVEETRILREKGDPSIISKIMNIPYR